MSNQIIELQYFSQEWQIPSHTYEEINFWRLVSIGKEDSRKKKKINPFDHMYQKSTDLHSSQINIPSLCESLVTFLYLLMTDELEAVQEL